MTPFCNQISVDWSWDFGISFLCHFILGLDFCSLWILITLNLYPLPLPRGEPFFSDSDLNLFQSYHQLSLNCIYFYFPSHITTTLHHSIVLFFKVDFLYPPIASHQSSMTTFITVASHSGYRIIIAASQPAILQHHLPSRFFFEVASSRTVFSHSFTLRGRSGLYLFGTFHTCSWILCKLQVRICFQSHS